MTRAMLEERFDGPLVERLVSARPGKVIGPRRDREKFTLHAPNERPLTLTVAKLTQHEPARRSPLEVHAGDIRRALLRRKLAEQLSGALAAGRNGHYAWYGGLRYDVAVLAERAREQGIQDRPGVRRALGRSAREAQLDARIGAYLDRPVPAAEIERHVQARAADWTQQDDLLSVRHLFFAKREDAGRAAELLGAGHTIDEIITEMQIENKNEPRGRASSAYYEDILLNQRIAWMLAGQNIFPQLNLLEAGEISGVVESEAGSHIFRLDQRLPARELTVSGMRAVACKEIQRQRERELMDKLAPGTTHTENEPDVGSGSGG
jgi:hypothetical protein